MITTCLAAGFRPFGCGALLVTTFVLFLVITALPAGADFSFTFVEQFGRVSLVPEEATTDCFLSDYDVCFIVTYFPIPSVDLPTPEQPCANSDFDPCFVYIADPSGLLISHIVSILRCSGCGYWWIIGIRSASDPVSGLGTCAAVGGCQLVKDGTVQLVGRVYTVAEDGWAEIRFQSLDVISRPSISVAYGGTITDRVGQGEFARNPDGQLDGVFTVTLNTGSGDRVINRLDLVRNNGDGVWNTNPGDVFWVLGAAGTELSALLNGSDDRVSFPVSDGGTFKIFAADFQNRMFTGGSTFVLTASFSDGTTATASITIPVTTITPTLTYNGALRDRVGQNNS